MPCRNRRSFEYGPGELGHQRRKLSLLQVLAFAALFSYHAILTRSVMFFFLRNTGSSSSPAYTRLTGTDNPMYNVDNQAKDYLQTYSTVYPAVLSCGDWTGDGLIDCMLAGMHGTLQLAINSGPPTLSISHTHTSL